MFNSKFVTLLFLGGLAACSTAQVRVMPGEHSNRVVVRDIERDDAESEALEAAQEYCAKRGLDAVIVRDGGTKYSGQMDEDTRNTIRTGSKVAMLLSGPVAVSGGHGVREPNPIGGLLGTAGAVGYTATNDRDYVSQIEFRCR